MSDTVYGPASFFEISNALAFNLFQERSVDYAVIETGIGGLYDSTNSISRVDKLAIITKLGYDHTEILGNTLGEIASQKAGIINDNSDVLALLPTDKNAQQTIEMTAQARHASIEFIEPTKHYADLVHSANGTVFNYYGNDLSLTNLTLSLMGEHQVENTVIALQALEFLSKRDHFRIQPRIVLDVLAHIRIPGRFEICNYQNQKVILDGAHNPQKISALVKTLANYSENRVVAVIALKSDKELDTIAGILAEHVHTAIVSQYAINPDDKVHAPMSPELIAAKLSDKGVKVTIETTSPKQVLHKAIKAVRDNEPILITGSIYFVGEMGNYIKSM